MIKSVIEEAINKQIAKELYSSHLYLSMAGFFKSINLNGFANWMRIQAQEENMHAMKFFDYLLERGGNAQIYKIEAPPNKWESPLAVFENTLEHEQMVTSSINDIADLAIHEKDHATNIFLQWFISEQVEEEATTGEILDRLKLAGDARAALFMLDNELKTRQLTPVDPNA